MTSAAIDGSTGHHLPLSPLPIRCHLQAPSCPSTSLPLPLEPLCLLVAGWRGFAPFSAVDVVAGPRTTASSTPVHPSIKIVDGFPLLPSTSPTPPFASWWPEASSPSGNHRRRPHGARIHGAHPCFPAPVTSIPEGGAVGRTFPSPRWPAAVRQATAVSGWRLAAGPARAASGSLPRAVRAQEAANGGGGGAPSQAPVAGGGRQGGGGGRRPS